MLEAKNISIGYNNSILSNINLSCDFEVIALIGANGSGKTTLLKSISGLIPLKSGNILINNINIDDMSNAEQAHYIANIFTNQPINELLKVIDILSFGRIPYLSLGGKLKKEDVEIIEHYIQEFNLNPLKHKIFRDLSDGEKQQVMIARALIQKTPILLLDEPTAHLDIVNKRNVFNTLKSIKENEGKLIIIITHDISLALEFADSIWLIDKDKTFQTFQTKDIKKEDLLEKLF